MLLRALQAAAAFVAGCNLGYGVANLLYSNAAIAGVHIALAIALFAISIVPAPEAASGSAD